MNISWIAAYNRLFPILDRSGDTYHSGPAFIRMAQQVDLNIPEYTSYIEQSNAQGKSTTRKVFYWDIIAAMSEQQRHDLFRLFIESLEPLAKEEIADLKAYLYGQSAPVPRATIPNDLWSSEKLSRSLSEIDRAIEANDFSRAVTLTYTCLEGLYKAYCKKNIAGSEAINDLLPLAKVVKNDVLNKVRGSTQAPEQIINTISSITNAIANSRNGFSESHFDQDAQRWLAVYARDLTNSIGRLLLHFM